MSNANPSRVGQINATGDTEALWLKKAAGEVLTAYGHSRVLKPTVRVRTVSGQKSAQFPATYRVRARYHTPGTEILGQNVKHNEVTVTLDDLLIADVFVASIDELKNHYDVRAPYTTEIGEALANFEDRTIGQVIVKAARGAELFAGDGGGSNVTQANVSGSADFDASGADLISAINLSLQKMEEKRVPVGRMPVHAAFLPAQWYLLANSEKNINKDYGGDGSVKTMSLSTLSGVNIHKSTALLFGKDVTEYHASTNTNGVVMNSGGLYSTADIGAEEALPFEFPSKYRLDLVNTRGAVWVEPAVAFLQLLGIQMEVARDPRRRGHLLIAESAVGMDALRTKCAVEIKTS